MALNSGMRLEAVLRKRTSRYVPRLPCLRVIALWTDTQKEYACHLTTSASDADPQRKRALFFIFFVSTHLSRVVGKGYLAQCFLSDIDGAIKIIASFIKLSGWFSSMG